MALITKRPPTRLTLGLRRHAGALAFGPCHAAGQGPSRPSSCRKPAPPVLVTSPGPSHITRRTGALRDGDAKCFCRHRAAVSSSVGRCARAQIRRDLPPASKGAGFPTPVPAKAGPMPAHEGLGPDDPDCPEDRWEPSIQLDQEQAIPICELESTAHPPPQHNQLMAKRSIPCRKSALRLERRGKQGQEEAEQRNHCR
jgi:hypothetical protein